MDTPPPESQYKLSYHSYYSNLAYYYPTAWVDTGHAFVSLSKDDEVIAAVGLWPMEKDTRDSDIGIHYSTLVRWNKSQPGRVRSELETLRDHEGDLRTQSWDITPEQAKQTFLKMQKDVSGVKSYDLYTDNCATYAKGFVDEIGVDSSNISTKGCYFSTLRPSVVWPKLPLEKRGTLKLPPEHEMTSGWKTEKGYREELALTQPDVYLKMLEQEERSRLYRIQFEERLKKEKEKSVESEPLVISPPEHSSTPPKTKDDKPKHQLNDL